MMVLPRCKGLHHLLSRLLLLLPLVGTIAQAQIPLDLNDDGKRLYLPHSRLTKVLTILC